MPVLPITVRNKIATYTADVPYVCGNSDYTAVFTFDEEWNEHTQKTARFVYGSSYTDVLFEGDECPFPVIEEATMIVVGVFAGNLRTSTGASVKACYSIRSGFGAPENPTPDVYDQIMERLDELSHGGTGGNINITYDETTGDLSITSSSGGVSYDDTTGNLTIGG